MNKKTLERLKDARRILLIARNEETHEETQKELNNILTSIYNLIFNK